MSTTTFNALEDIYNLTREQVKAEYKMIFSDMILNKYIEEPVLICNRETRDIIERELPHRFCILANDLCENKVYMVTDRELADNIRQNLNWLRENNNDT